MKLTRQSFIETISSKLTREQSAPLVPGRSASVAVILRDSDREEDVLLIKRAERDADPWSGQVAFPGGMVNKNDRSFEKTARRETEEEVGIDLAPGQAVFLGYMGGTKTHMREIVVVPSVFKLLRVAQVRLSSEVASTEWVPLKELAMDEARSVFLLRRSGREDVPFPSFTHKGLVIWGLTERILSAIIGMREEKTVRDSAFRKIESY